MATYYIAPTGNDTTGNGSQGNPWQTINKAITASASGDTINLSAGTFAWPSAPPVLADRTLIGQGTDKTVVDGAGATLAGWTMTGTTTIQKIRFTNAVKSSAGNTGLFAVGANGTHVITFDNCQFDGLTWNFANAGGIILIVYSVTGSVILNVVNCLFYGCKSAGLSQDGHIWVANGSVTTANITNCTFFTNRSGAQNVVIIGGLGAGTLWVLKNNIFYDISGTSPQFVSASSPFYTGSNANVIYGYSSVPTLTGTIASDPMMVDPLNNLFQLRPGSPAVDAGV